MEFLRSLLRALGMLIGAAAQLPPRLWWHPGGTVSLRRAVHNYPWSCAQSLLHMHAMGVDNTAVWSWPLDTALHVFIYVRVA